MSLAFVVAIFYDQLTWIEVVISYTASNNHKICNGCADILLQALLWVEVKDEAEVV